MKRTLVGVADECHFDGNITRKPITVPGTGIDAKLLLEHVLRGQYEVNPVGVDRQGSGTQSLANHGGYIVVAKISAQRVIVCDTPCVIDAVYDRVLLTPWVIVVITAVSIRRRTN